MLIVAINYLYADPDLNSHLDGTGSWTRLDSKIKIYLYILQKKRSSSFSCISFALRQIELRPRDFRSIFLLINPLWASVTEPHTF